jgi:hypothetical protein
LSTIGRRAPRACAPRRRADAGSAPSAEGALTTPASIAACATSSCSGATPK